VGLKGTIATIGFTTGTPSAAQDLTQTSGSTKFPYGSSMGNKYLDNRDGVSGTTGKGYALANHFDRAATGYQFDCAALKYGLSHDSAGAGTSTVGSRVYLKISGDVSAGNVMPAVTTSATDTDARSNPVVMVSAQLNVIKDWMDVNIGNGDCNQ